MRPRGGDEVGKSSLGGGRGRRACPPRLAAPDRRPAPLRPSPAKLLGRRAPPPYRPPFRFRRPRPLWAPPESPLAAARRVRRLGPSSTAGRRAARRECSPAARPPTGLRGRGAFPPN